jgi:hypothetical protein
MNARSRHASSRVAGALAATLLAIAATAAIAQTQPAQPAEPTAPSALPQSPTLKLTTQEEYVIREVLLTDANVPKEKSAPENIGDSVPDSVELRTLPPEIVKKVPRAQSHKYFVQNDAVYLVSPSDRRIALVLKKKPTD